MKNSEFKKGNGKHGHSQNKPLYYVLAKITMLADIRKNFMFSNTIYKPK